MRRSRSCVPGACSAVPAASPARRADVRTLAAACLLASAALPGCSTEPASATQRGRPIFDGRTLDGWVTRGGPYDGDATWTVEDGALTGRPGTRGEGGLIYTERPYGEFVLTLECRLDRPFDSGVFLRMAPRGKGAQITLDHRDGGEIGAIYSDGFLRHNPDGARLWRDDGWNRIEVRATGEDMRIAVQLNGSALVDFQMPPGDEYAPTGRIGLQVHGDRDDPARNACRFRNIRIEELSVTSTEPFRRGMDGQLETTPWGRALGWKRLFDGVSLAGWEMAGGASGFEVREGAIVLLTRGDSPYLRTLEDFADFALRLDFRIAPMTNSGVFLRGERGGGDPAWSGCEVQILDDHDWERVTGTKLQPWQLCGSLYGSVAPAVSALEPAGAWNTYEIECRGTHMSAVLNGQELWSVDTLAVDVPEGRPPFAERPLSGLIGLQRHAPEHVQGEAYAWFRNIYVRSF